MSKYRALVSHIAHGQIEHTAIDGVIELPDDELHLFAALVECGWLVAIDDPLVVVVKGGIVPPGEYLVAEDSAQDEVVVPADKPKAKRGKRG